MWLGYYEEDDLQKLLHAMQNLENFNILEVPPQIFFEVVEAVAAVVKLGKKIEWIDKVLDEIGAKKDHCALLQKA